MLSPPLTLVALAAGLGSRFGGTKQLAEVGPHGEAVLDYTIHDARLVGFERFVLVVRTDLVDPVTEHLRAIHGDDLDAALVLQDRFGPTRPKPWGTGHAVLAAATELHGPFGVVNADDFYGRRGLEVLADALRAPAAATEHHLVAYRLAATLSPGGTVSRGVCTVDAAGNLADLVETAAIARGSDGRIHGEAGGRPVVLEDDRPVSMNLLGLQPSILDELATAWASFRDEATEDAEFILPGVLGTLADQGRATVRVHRTDAVWHGVTYASDAAEVRAAIAAEVAAGTYPAPLGGRP